MWEREGGKENMEQRTLFDMGNPPATHATDPESSRVAEQRHTECGRRDAHSKLVLKMVKNFPARTAVELWEFADEAQKKALVELQEVRRRLTDLAARGLVVQCGEKICSVRGSLQVMWVVP